MSTTSYECFDSASLSAPAARAAGRPAWPTALTAAAVACSSARAFSRCSAKRSRGPEEKLVQPSTSESPNASTRSREAVATVESRAKDIDKSNTRTSASRSASEARRRLRADATGRAEEQFALHDAPTSQPAKRRQAHLQHIDHVAIIYSA
eukprot:2184395-Prymnesium_polylepis.1